MKQKILIVEDDQEVMEYVKDLLNEAGYGTLAAFDGSSALHIALEEQPTLVILDLNIPRINGFEICRQIREQSEVPIIILSARQNEEDKVRCLDMGADDYITKPFGSKEFLARVKTALRHKKTVKTPVQDTVTASGGLSLDFSAMRVTVNGNPVKLTPTEFQILGELILNKGKVLTHGYLLEHIWGSEFKHDREYLHVFIGRLRHKLQNEQSHEYITTIPGIGYRLVD